MIEYDGGYQVTSLIQACLFFFLVKCTLCCYQSEILVRCKKVVFPHFIENIKQIQTKEVRKLYVKCRLKIYIQYNVCITIYLCEI